jgi:predicted RNA-binding protein with PIN domain
VPLVRLERVGGGALSTPAGVGRGGDASREMTDMLLRHALETALHVAREGEEDTPAVPAPVPLRPFLRFAKLPRHALAATRRVLDTDDEFRARVAEAADESMVGRPGWLFLTRPEGWEDELRALVASAEEEAGQEAERKAEQDARRRLAGAEEAARRAEQAASSARVEAAQAAAALADERRARMAAAAEAAAVAERLTQRVEAIRAERDRVRASAAAAADEAGTLRRRVAELEDEVKDLKDELKASGAGAAGAGAGAAGPLGAAAAGVAAGVAAAAAETPPGEEGEVELAGLGRLGAEVGRALREAAAAATRLADALAAAAAPLEGEPEAPGEGPPEHAPARLASLAPPPATERRRVEAPVRRPVPLPPAIFDDSVEAADHLVRVSGVALVVDGYNVSQTGWPELPLAEQRRRLVAALGELAARTGADVRVVFDGADLAMPSVVPTTSQLVRVTFSSPGVEADDEVLAMVSDLPLHRPVVVATSDRAVQHGAMRVGANVISSSQLLALLGR